MWNSGKDILWSHISRIAYDESNRGLKLITVSLTVRLTPYSKMNVSLATQVLSKCQQYPLWILSSRKSWYSRVMHVYGQ